jgi:hypothetical protein
MRSAGAAITLGLLLAGSAAASAQIFTPQTLDRYFRVEWQLTRNRTGPTIDGYVYNQAVQAAERMRLQIDRLDASGGVVGHSTVWVLGDIPKNGRAYFRASVPEATSYRVQVLAFDWNCSDGGGCSRRLPG